MCEQVCWVYYILYKSDVPLPLSWLNDAELGWLQGKSAKRRINFVWARAILRKICCEKFNVLPEQVQIELPAASKTKLLVKGKQVFCSISHSRQLIAVAISPNFAIGLDVEYASYYRDTQAYASIYPALQYSHNTTTLFYQRWTAIEASIKLQGGQLFEILAEINPTLAPQLIHWQLLNYQFCIASYNHIKPDCIQIDNDSFTNRDSL